jgi:hypothetical protein
MHRLRHPSDVYAHDIEGSLTGFNYLRSIGIWTPATPLVRSRYTGPGYHPCLSSFQKRMGHV